MEEEDGDVFEIETDGASDIDRCSGDGVRTDVMFTTSRPDTPVYVANIPTILEECEHLSASKKDLEDAIMDADDAAFSHFGEGSVKVALAAVPARISSRRRRQHESESDDEDLVSADGTERCSESDSKRVGLSGTIRSIEHQKETDTDTPHSVEDDVEDLFDATFDGKKASKRGDADVSSAEAAAKVAIENISTAISRLNMSTTLTEHRPLYITEDKKAPPSDPPIKSKAVIIAIHGKFVVFRRANSRKLGVGVVDGNGVDDHFVYKQWLEQLPESPDIYTDAIPFTSAVDRKERFATETYFLLVTRDVKREDTGAFYVWHLNSGKLFVKDGFRVPSPYTLPMAWGESISSDPVARSIPEDHFRTGKYLVNPSTAVLTPEWIVITSQTNRVKSNTDDSAGSTQMPEDGGIESFTNVIAYRWRRDPVFEASWGVICGSKGLDSSMYPRNTPVGRCAYIATSLVGISHAVVDAAVPSIVWYITTSGPASLNTAIYSKLWAVVCSVDFQQNVAAQPLEKAETECDATPVSIRPMSDRCASLLSRYQWAISAWLDPALIGSIRTHFESMSPDGNGKFKSIAGSALEIAASVRGMTVPTYDGDIVGRCIATGEDGQLIWVLQDTMTSTGTIFYVDRNHRVIHRWHMDGVISAVPLRTQRMVLLYTDFEVIVGVRSPNPKGDKTPDQAISRLYKSDLKETEDGEEGLVRMASVVTENVPITQYLMAETVVNQKTVVIAHTYEDVLFPHFASTGK